MTKFSVAEYMRSWTCCQIRSQKYYDIGCSRRSAITSRDTFLQLQTFLKTKVNGTMLKKNFDMKKQMIEQLIVELNETISSSLVEARARSINKRYSMALIPK